MILNRLADDLHVATNLVHIAAYRVDVALTDLQLAPVGGLDGLLDVPTEGILVESCANTKEGGVRLSVWAAGLLEK